MEWRNEKSSNYQTRGGPDERGVLLPWDEGPAEYCQECNPKDDWRFGFGGRGRGDGPGGIYSEFEHQRGSVYNCGPVQFRGQAARSSAYVFGESAEEAQSRIQDHPEEHVQLAGEDLLTERFRAADRMRDLLITRGQMPKRVASERMLLEFTPDEAEEIIAASNVLKELYVMHRNRREDGIVAAAKFVLENLGGVN